MTVVSIEKQCHNFIVKTVIDGVLDQVFIQPFKNKLYIYFAVYEDKNIRDIIESQFLHNNIDHLNANS